MAALTINLNPITNWLKPHEVSLNLVQATPEDHVKVTQEQYELYCEMGSTFQVTVTIGEDRVARFAEKCAWDLFSSGHRICLQVDVGFVCKCTSDWLATSQGFFFCLKAPWRRRRQQGVR